MDEKYELILRKSALVFMKYGIRSISMDDICRELSISKKTLYQFVESKNDLVEKILDYVLIESHRCDQLKTGNAIDKILEVSKHVFETLRNFNPAVTFDLQKFYPEQYRKIQQKHHDIVYRDTVENIKAGIEEGLYRENIEVELEAHLYANKLEQITSIEFMSTHEFSFEKIFAVMFEGHIRSIANPKGIEYFENKKNSLNYNI